MEKEDDPIVDYPDMVAKAVKIKDLSAVSFMGEHVGQSCSYCEKDSGKVSYMLASDYPLKLKPKHYQMLIDHGWVRYGVICLKPPLKESCCPEYTMRCKALEFKLKKSHRKVLNKMRRFLQSDDYSDLKKWKRKCEAHITAHLSQDSENELEKTCPDSGEPKLMASYVDSSRKSEVLNNSLQKLSLDCKNGGSHCMDTDSSKTVKKPLQLMAMIPHLNPDDSVKKSLKVELIRAEFGGPEINCRSIESFEIYRKYQLNVHKQSPDDITLHDWYVSTVISSVAYDVSGPGPGYGNFHQHYILDGRLIAVGVIEILPKCVSSLCFYYDPDYAFLSLGTYSAISEIAYVQELHKSSEDMMYYYLGPYVHKCSKMNYKANYLPADLSCPVSFNWVPIEKCIPALEKETYVELGKLIGLTVKEPELDMNAVRICYSNSLIPYPLYVRLRYRKRSPDGNWDQDIADELVEIKKYLSLVGSDVASEMCLVRLDQIKAKKLVTR